MSAISLLKEELYFLIIRSLRDASGFFVFFVNYLFCLLWPQLLNVSIFKEMNFYLFVFSETSFPNKQGDTILCNIFIPAVRMYLLIGSLFI